MRKLLTFLIALASIALGAYTSASAQSIGVRTAILSKPPAAAYPVMSLHGKYFGRCELIAQRRAAQS
jgi:hypothetical protein